MPASIMVMGTPEFPNRFQAGRTEATDMAAKLKTFVTESGFYELAVAAPSMPAALRAWGMTHDAFGLGLARKTDDPAIVKAAISAPGTVLRRPLGSKSGFSVDAQLPHVKGSAKKKATPKTANSDAVQRVQSTLEEARADHEATEAALRDELGAARVRYDEEQKRWRDEESQLKARLTHAKSLH